MSRPRLSKNLAFRRLNSVACAALITLAGCGGSGADATIGGTLSGLAAGRNVTLEDNAASNLVLDANGTFQFAATLPTGASYDVAVATQPVGQTCTVTNGSGTVPSVDNVTDVAVTCAVTASVSGTVTGLSAGGAVTLSNGSVLLPIAANGAFSFPGALASGSAYAVTVATQPVGQVCTITGASGTVPASQIVSIAVACS